MTILEFLAARPDLIETLRWWGWCLVLGGTVRLVLGGAR